MKKAILRLSLVALLFLCAVPTFADWRFGLRASYDNTGATWTINDEKFSTRNISGFSVGPSVAYEVIDYFSVQSGVFFSMNGFATGDHSFVKSIEYVAEETVRLYYLQFPIYAVGQYPLDSDAILLLEAGPKFGCGLTDQVTTSIDIIHTDIHQEYNESNVAFDEKLSRFNVAMHVGIGAEYMGARLMVGYDFGLYNMALMEDTQLKSGGFTVSIGYMF